MRKISRDFLRNKSMRWDWMRVLFFVLLFGGSMESADAAPLDAQKLASDVVIRRDGFGVPHIEGKTDAATFFGFAYAQCEDYFWQLEDNIILSVGRYSEAHGSQGYNSDLLNRAFEIAPRSQKDFSKLDPAMQEMATSFTMGINYYLARHPEVKPRMIQKFEPWHIVAFTRHGILELSYRRTGLSKKMPRDYEEIWSMTGSNGWSIAGSKTRSGHPMILINPHQPWYCFGQLYEAHL
jgi:acyl-homoserine lactone acylase PvdQ